MTEIDKKELKELFIQIKNNNKTAYEKLYTKYSSLIYAIAFTIVKNKEDSEDIVQNIFYKLYEIDKHKLPNDNETSWLYSLTKNETISFLRRKSNNVDLDSIYEIETNNTEIDDIVDKVEFNKLISKLNDKEKQIISLKMISNFSFDEIGKLLDEPTGTIKWRYYRSIHTLKILLSNLGMFIITFTVGITTFLNTSKNEKQTQNKTEAEAKEETQEGEVEGEQPKKETVDIQKDIESKNSSKENEIKEETILESEPIKNEQNYLSIGILGISSVFLCITIIFIISYTKYQLKGRIKSSKY